MAIRKVIHCSDIHIKNLLRHDEYAEQLTKFIEKCQEICEPYEKNEVRIVITGDLIDQKNNITPELITFVSTFIRELETIAQVIVIAGNHDLIVNNLSAGAQLRRFVSDRLAASFRFRISEYHKFACNII